MKELEKSIQIKVLKGAVKKLKHDEIINSCCNAIIVSSMELAGVYVECSDLHSLIPSFTRENAQRLSKQKKFKKPSFKNSFWWSCGNYRNVRIRFLNGLISEIKSTM
jgi:hypothetical protein